MNTQQPLLHVHEDAIKETTRPIAARQKFEKTFTISHAVVGSKTAPAIRHLALQTPGVTFVSFDASATTPIVKISSELPEALEAIQVLAHSDSGLEICVGRRSLARQYLLIEVVLPTAHTLLSLDTTGSGTVVVQDNVLVANDAHADIRIAVVGSGDVLVTTHSAMAVRSLSLDLSGSGDVQFVAASITATDAFLTQIASSGGVQVFTSTINVPRATATISGSGDTQLAALSSQVSKELSVQIGGSGTVSIIGDELMAGLVAASIGGSGDAKFVATNTFSASEVNASVAGSGCIQVASKHAHCDESTLSVTGSGSIDARDLAARHATVSILGSGSALFRASQVADTYVGGSGSAAIVGELPPRVTGNPKVKTEAKKPSQVERLSRRRRLPVPEPTKVDAFEKLTGFNGTYNATNISEFMNGVSAMWHGTGNRVMFKSGNASSEP